MNPISSDTDRVVFPLLADPAGYRANTIDLASDPESLRVWLDIFRAHCDSLEPYAAASQGDTEDARRRAAACVARWRIVLDEIEADPMRHGEPNVPRFCTLREGLLREHGFEDAYVTIKAEENAAALRLLPGVLAELDEIGDPDRLLRTHLEHVFAGNIFDLGCAVTTDLFESGDMNFHATVDRLPDRPWLVDDLDALTARFAGAVHRKAIVFVDNAGADVTLGMIPLIRYLLKRGTRVVAAANTAPALNDIIHDEFVDHLGAIAAFDAPIRDALADGRLSLVASGNGIPLIDLTGVSPGLAAASADADLLILEGMGRAIESNYEARFTCDTLKLAMLKEPDVARRLGGGLYDVVCRFEPVA